MSDDPIYKAPDIDRSGMQTVFDQIDAPIEMDQSENDSAGQGQETHFPGGGASGFDEIDVVLCRNGSPVKGKILFKED